jgi:hypothetical protein
MLLSHISAKSTAGPRTPACARVVAIVFCAVSLPSRPHYAARWEGEPRRWSLTPGLFLVGRSDASKPQVLRNRRRASLSQHLRFTRASRRPRKGPPAYLNNNLAACDESRWRRFPITPQRAGGDAPRERSSRMPSKNGRARSFPSSLRSDPLQGRPVGNGGTRQHRRFPAGNCPHVLTRRRFRFARKGPFQP